MRRCRCRYHATALAAPLWALALQLDSTTAVKAAIGKAAIGNAAQQTSQFELGALAALTVLEAASPDVAPQNSRSVQTLLEATTAPGTHGLSREAAYRGLFGSVALQWPELAAVYQCRAARAALRHGQRCAGSDLAGEFTQREAAQLLERDWTFDQEIIDLLWEGCARHSDALTPREALWLLKRMHECDTPRAVGLASIALQLRAVAAVAQAANAARGVSSVAVAGRVLGAITSARAGPSKRRAELWLPSEMGHHVDIPVVRKLCAALLERCIVLLRRDSPTDPSEVEAVLSAQDVVSAEVLAGLVTESVVRRAVYGTDDYNDRLRLLAAGSGVHRTFAPLGLDVCREHTAEGLLTAVVALKLTLHGADAIAAVECCRGLLADVALSDDVALCSEFSLRLAEAATGAPATARERYRGLLTELASTCTKCQTTSRGRLWGLHAALRCARAIDSRSSVVPLITGEVLAEVAHHLRRHYCLESHVGLLQVMCWSDKLRELLPHATASLAMIQLLLDESGSSLTRGQRADLAFVGKVLKMQSL
jgi:hypothetical protein